MQKSQIDSFSASISEKKIKYMFTTMYDFVGFMHPKGLYVYPWNERAMNFTPLVGGICFMH